MRREEELHPYMKRLFWMDKQNHYWNNGMYKQSFIFKMNVWVKQVSQRDCGTIF